MSSSKEDWNIRYRSSEYVYGESPNLYFASIIDVLPAGRILLPAEGEGRNAVHAALKGWEVFAFDQSEVACEKAMQLAQKNNVTINYSVNDAMLTDYPEGYFDAIALLFAHFPASFRSDFHIRLCRYLKPGGRMILEGFSKGHLAYRQRNPDAGGPVDERLLFSPAEIMQDFSELDIKELKEHETALDEGILHKGPGLVLRMTAKKRS